MRLIVPRTNAEAKGEHKLGWTQSMMHKARFKKQTLSYWVCAPQINPSWCQRLRTAMDCSLLSLWILKQIQMAIMHPYVLWQQLTIQFQNIWYIAGFRAATNFEHCLKTILPLLSNKIVVMWAKWFLEQDCPLDNSTSDNRNPSAKKTTMWWPEIHVDFGGSPN